MTPASSNEPRDQLAEILRDQTPPIHAAASRALEKMYSEWGTTPGLPTPAVAMHRMADILAEEGWRPPPRVIEAGWDLLHMPIRTVLRDETTGALFEKRTGGFWHGLSGPQIGDAFTAGHRFTVLWEPGEADRG